MSKQESDVDSLPRTNSYPLWVFYLSFAIIAVEVITLITSNLWEGAAPDWTSEILDKRRELLALAAAVTLLLALILAFRPAGLAKYAALASGVISFAAAASVKIEEPVTVGAMLGLIFPLYIVYFPVIRFPQTWAIFIDCLVVSGFLSLVVMVVMLSIPLLQIKLFVAGFHSFGSFLFWSMVIGSFMTITIILANLALQMMGQWYFQHPDTKLHRTIQFTKSSYNKAIARQKGNRAARRRASRGK